MIKIIIIIFLSLFLECNLSNYIPINTNLFNNFLTVTSLIIISKMLDKKNKFYILSIIVGLIYDLIFTNRLGFSVLMFFLTAVFIKNIDKIVKTHFKIIQYLVIFIFYRFISYLILILTGYLSFNWLVILKAIYSSIIVNLIYIYILNLLFFKNHK